MECPICGFAKFLKEKGITLAVCEVLFYCLLMIAIISLLNLAAVMVSKMTDLPHRPASERHWSEYLSGPVYGG